jgi:hypothetical protein
MASVVGTSMNNGSNSKAADRITSPCLDALDIAGYNYTSGRYPLEGKAHPNRVIVGTETFPQDIAKNWAMVKKYPYLIGDFVWTAWDYLGEVGLGAWAYTDDARTFNKPYPWLVADAGVIDILGNIGAEVEYAATVWGLRDKPYIGVQPVNHPGMKPIKAVWRGTNAIASWSWKGCEGNKAIVEVYTNADSVRLLLGEKHLGIKKVKNFKAVFTTRYVPGILTAVALDPNRKEVSRSSLTSASGTIRINIIPEIDIVKVGKIAYIDIILIGENGEIESNSDTTLAVTVEGGELLAFGSANPRTEERYTSGKFTTYYGRSQAVVRAGYIPGKVVVTVSAEGIQHKTVEIELV